MTSFIRNRVLEFLTQNGYAENDIQKGFTPKVAGTLEHTSHMAYLINLSKRKQRSIVITLFCKVIVLVPYFSIFNTFITSIRSQEFEQLGYKYAQHLSPRHWYQFADDAAIVTGQQYENQILLNAFTG